MKPRRHDMLDFHPAAVVGSFLGGDPYEASPVDATPDPAPAKESRHFATAFRRRTRRAARWARAQAGHHSSY